MYHAVMRFSLNKSEQAPDLVDANSMAMPGEASSSSQGYKGKGGRGRGARKGGGKGKSAKGGGKEGGKEGTGGDPVPKVKTALQEAKAVPRLNSPSSYIIVWSTCC